MYVFYTCLHYIHYGILSIDLSQLECTTHQREILSFREMACQSNHSKKTGYRDILLPTETAQNMKWISFYKIIDIDRL